MPSSAAKRLTRPRGVSSQSISLPFVLSGYAGGGLTRPSRALRCHKKPLPHSLTSQPAPAPVRMFCQGRRGSVPPSRKLKPPLPSKLCGMSPAPLRSPNSGVGMLSRARSSRPATKAAREATISSAPLGTRCTPPLVPSSASSPTRPSTAVTRSCVRAGYSPASSVVIAISAFTPRLRSRQNCSSSLSSSFAPPRQSSSGSSPEIPYCHNLRRSALSRGRKERIAPYSAIAPASSSSRMPKSEAAPPTKEPRPSAPEARSRFAPRTAASASAARQSAKRTPGRSSLSSARTVTNGRSSTGPSPSRSGR